MLASVVINNFNYARYLRECIDSALAQSHPHVEVIVVDDGSTDDSRQIIDSYGDRLIPVYKSNGGQASAINVGFSRSRGEVVHFLDSDDTLYPDTIARAVEAFVAGKVDKVHWQLDVVREDGMLTGDRRPHGVPWSGDLRSFVWDTPSIDYNSPPQSGNMWTRRFLSQMMPLEEQIYRTGGGDTFLSMLSLAYGKIATLEGPHGTYRVHGTSHWSSVGFEQRVKMGLDRWTHTCHAVARLAQQSGHAVDARGWIHNSCFYREKQFADAILTHVPEGGAVAIADNGEIALPRDLRGRRVSAFPELNGYFGGAPKTSEEVVHELDRQLGLGVGFLGVAWPAFWWLDFYTGFAEELRKSPCVFEDGTIKLFDLRARPAPT